MNKLPEGQAAQTPETAVISPHLVLYIWGTLGVALIFMTTSWKDELMQKLGCSYINILHSKVQIYQKQDTEQAEVVFH